MVMRAIEAKELGTPSDEKKLKILLYESGVKNGVKPEYVKVPRYIDTRVDELYPVRKSNERFRVLRGKDKSKDAVSSVEMASDLDNLFVTENFPAEDVIRGKVGASRKSESSDSSNKAIDDQGFRKIENCSQNALRNVVEIHLGNENPSDCAKVDMEKALKGLVACDKSSIHSSFVDALGKNYDLPSTSARHMFPEFHISGHRAPLDFTLKTTLRLISSSSVKWCQRLNATPACFEIDLHTSKYFSNMDQRSTCTSGLSTTSEVMYSKALHSWAFPLSSLPSSIITAITLSATKGETDFLLRRRQDWEDSFRDLYYMLRKNICSMFYGSQSTQKQVPSQPNLLEVQGIITYEFEDGAKHMYLVRWKDQSPSEDTWMTREDLEKLAPTMVKDYLDFNSLGKISFESVGFDVAPMHQESSKDHHPPIKRRPITRSQISVRSSEHG